MSNIRRRYCNIICCGIVFLVAFCQAALPRIVIAQYAFPAGAPASDVTMSTPSTSSGLFVVPTTAYGQTAASGQPVMSTDVHSNAIDGANRVGQAPIAPSYPAQSTGQNTQQIASQYASPYVSPNVSQSFAPQSEQVLYSAAQPPVSQQVPSFGASLVSNQVMPSQTPAWQQPMQQSVQQPMQAPMQQPVQQPVTQFASPQGGEGVAAFSAMHSNVGENLGNSTTGGPNFIMPSENVGDLPKLAYGGGIGNAYDGTGQSGGAVPAFRPLGNQETPTTQGLNVIKRERPDDRRLADQQYIDTWKKCKDRQNPDVWKEQMPPYTGPLANRTDGKPDDDPAIMQVRYFDFKVKQDDYEYDWEKDTPHAFDFSMLDPMRFGEQVKRWVGLGEDEAKARQYMEKGLQLMKDEEYVKAAKEFEWAAYYWPETAVEEDARYHAAECYYRSGRYYDATKEYTKLLTNYQSSQYKSESVRNMFGIARIWIEQVTEKKAGYVNVSDKSRPTFDTFGYAEKALKTIYSNCPSDPLADDSVYMLAHAYMRRGKVQGDANFEHAADYFKQLRDHYPNSEFIVEAMRLEAICRQRASLGAAYATKHIDEAGNIADQLLGQHGTTLDSQKRNEILELRNHITEEKAHSIWEIGQHYDARKDYGSARLQYQRIINEYPTTEFAEKARKRIEEIRDYPDELPSDGERIASWVKARFSFGRK